ncbi:8209_t:CDS:2, partial [Paraglomus brasilianum]
MVESTVSSARQRLEPYLLLAKSTKGAAAVQLIKEVLAKPGVYVFAELLKADNIKELDNDENYKQYYTLLRLFSYGTYKDYKENRDSLPQLDNAQLNKLKHLSIVSLSETTRTIPYSRLLEYLDIPNVRELEDLIIEAIYQGVVKGKLDQKKKQLGVEYTMGRDLRPGQIDQMLKVLADWSTTSEEMLKAIDDKIVEIRDAQTANKLEREEYEREVERSRKEVTKSSKNSDRGPSDMDIMTGVAMQLEQSSSIDIDENPRRGK